MRKAGVMATAILVLAGIGAAARADITVKSTVTSKGIVGLTNMEGTHTEMIAGGMAKTVADMRMTSKVMKFLGAGKPQETAEIIRLDKELFWDVNFKEKEYKERTFGEVREEMEKGLKDAEKERAKYAKEHPEEADKLSTEVKVERTGKSQKIAGYDCEETVITMMVYGKNSESGEAGAMKVAMDLWLAKDVPGADDFQKFYTELAAKLGFTGHSQQSMEGMLAAFGVDPRELYKHTKDLQGMSMLSTVTLGMEGREASQGGGQPEVKQPKQEKEQERGDEGGKLGMAKKLGGFLGKKKDKEQKTEEPAKKNLDGRQGEQAGPEYLMQFTTTVTEISSSGIAGSEFEAPAGFKKK